jgi:hypothetical protein
MVARARRFTGHPLRIGNTPCPGIADPAFGLSDTVLHFFYNAVAYAGLVYAYLVVLRDRGFAFRR